MVFVLCTRGRRALVSVLTKTPREQEKDREIAQLKDEARRQALLMSSLQQDDDVRRQLEHKQNVSDTAASAAAALLDNIEGSLTRLSDVVESSALSATCVSAQLSSVQNKYSQSTDIVKELQAVMAKAHKLDG
jgi:hypothetical protein